MLSRSSASSQTYHPAAGGTNLLHQCTPGEGFRGITWFTWTWTPTDSFVLLLGEGAGTLGLTLHLAGGCSGTGAAETGY